MKLHMWNLFIDDERYPPDDGQIWEIARCYGDVLTLLKEYGSMPFHISFDHDLGLMSVDGYFIAKKLVELDMDKEYCFLPGFTFYVHSQNPVGKKNIEEYLDGYFAAKQKAKEV